MVGLLFIYAIQNEIVTTILFIITPKRIKYLKINLTKEVKNLFTENHKTLMKKTEEYINK